MYLTNITKQEGEDNSITWQVENIELIEIPEDKAKTLIGNWAIYYLTANNTINYATWWTPTEVEFVVDGKKYYYQKYHCFPKSTNYYMKKESYERYNSTSSKI